MLVSVVDAFNMSFRVWERRIRRANKSQVWEEEESGPGRIHCPGLCLSRTKRRRLPDVFPDQHPGVESESAGVCRRSMVSAHAYPLAHARLRLRARAPPRMRSRPPARARLPY